MSRQGTQRGSIERRGESWFLRIRDTQVDEATGQLRSRRVRIELGSSAQIRSQAAARRLADAWCARRYPARLQAGTPIRFADAAQRFLDVEVALFRKSSQRHYRSIIRHHLLPAFASWPLPDVDTAAARALMAKVSKTGTRRSTAANIKRVLLHLVRACRADGFDTAVIDARAVKLPRDEIAELERRHISDDELQRILESSIPPWRALWAVMGLLGLRVSEALGLTWDHLEIEGDTPTARIRQSSAHGLLLPLKTRTSRADLPMSDELAAILREHRVAWRSNPLGLLFATRAGTPLHSDNVRRRQLQPLLARLGIPTAGTHAFRHGLAGNLLQRGVSPQIVRQLLRHATLDMTSRYSHTSASDLRAAISAGAQRKANADDRNTAHPSPKLTHSESGAP